MQSHQTITFGILTVSDRCFRKEAIDESGPALATILTEGKYFSNYKIVAKTCVEDEVEAIEGTLREWVDTDDIHVILTTGGTGFAARDVTPEATRNVIDKEAPALAVAMVKCGLEKTPLAMLSRAVCGIRRQSVIINLPGSKKAATECLDAVIQCIPHAVTLTRGWSDNVHLAHSIVDSNAHKFVDRNSSNYPGISGIICNANNVTDKCSHIACDNGGQPRSKVDTTCVARRQRSSPYPIVSYPESIKLLDAVLSTLDRAVREMPVRCALGYALAKEVVAVENLPPFRASVKDGYAVVASDGTGIRQVVAASTAGSQPNLCKIESGQCMRVNTGAPVPDGADAVIQVEDTKLVTELDNGRVELDIDILLAPKVNQDIREIGSDIKKGQTVGRITGHPLASQDLALFTAAGVQNIQVFGQPVVAVFSTGNELQEPGHKLAPGQVWDSNRLMLSSLLVQNNYDILDLGISRDEPNEMLTKMRAALKTADIIVTTGSVSMGDKDMLKEILTCDLGAKIQFGRVNLKPGKPTTFATYTGDGSRTKLIFCLPGNPVSAFVTCHLYLLRALRTLSGFTNINLTSVQARIQSRLRLHDREEFKRGILTCKGNEDATVAIVGGCMLSSNISSCQASNCLVRIPPHTQSASSFLEINTFVECLINDKL